eukprot:TRINITY_DN11172_c0_g1_i1.p1 TRINITY_DN11172_c0_g1~~TRINITY_DN11172_c0_g1_i1.p1  ORF type:complete len:196 (-),score=34.56 TRINITY_DN11172_c0_g1_i1:349-936(-)
MMSTLPTSEADLRVGMVSDSSSVKSTATDVSDGTSPDAADMRLENSYWPQQHQQQLQTYVRDELISNLQLQVQLLIHQHLQLLLHQHHQHLQLSLQGTAPPVSGILTEDTLADFSFSKAPSLDTFPGIVGSTDSQEDEDTQSQPDSITSFRKPQGPHSETWVVSIRNTFVHVAVPDARLDRSKSVPAIMKYGHAT